MRYRFNERRSYLSNILFRTSATHQIEAVGDGWGNLEGAAFELLCLMNDCVK